jgi:hypothetical protein
LAANILLAISNSINSPRHVNAAEEGSERLRRTSALPAKASNIGTAKIDAACHNRTRAPQQTPGNSITSSARPSSVIGKTSFPLLVDYGCAARSAARTMRLTFLIAK